MQPEWKGRLDHWIETLKKEFYEPLGEIEFKGFLTFDQLTAEQAQAREDFAPMPEGTRWGEEWQYAWMRAEIVLPETAQGQRIVMNLDPGGESTIFVNGKSFGACRADWVGIPHHHYVDQTLTMEGQPGERFDLLLEAYAGHPLWADAPPVRCGRAIMRRPIPKRPAKWWEAIPSASGMRAPISSGWMSKCSRKSWKWAIPMPCAPRKSSRRCVISP